METDVYQPAEDTFLLAEVAVTRFGPGDRVLDVGCGSGFVGARVADHGATVIASDINPHACQRAANRDLETVRANLTDAFRADTFDGVLFNPPYLPAIPETNSDDWMSRALSAGDEGRAIINPFLDTVGRVLRPDGQILLLVSSLTGIEAVRERARSNGLGSEILEEHRFPYERLAVLSLEIT